MDPVPTIYGGRVLQATAPSLLPPPNSSRKLPWEPALIIPDEVETFILMNNINKIEDLSETSSPHGFTFTNLEYTALFYRIVYEEGDITPYLDSIEVSQDLHVKLHQ